MAFLGNTPTTQAFTPAVDFFSGNASTTAFTLSRPVASVAQVEVYVSNVPQTPSTAYTVSSNTITFTSAPPSGTNNIYVYYTSPITQVITPGQGTVTSSSFGTITDFTTTGNTTLGDATTDTLTVGVTGIVKDASGNVGIGTSSPADNLHVVANTTTENGIRVQNLNASGQSAVQYYNNSGTQKADVWWNNNGSTFNVRTLSTDPMVFSTNNTEVGRFDSAGLFKFNSGYGSVATAYGCRAWVNFNGTGTVAIRASGNVSSITDNGTGDYTVNFTNAMPDGNYSVATCHQSIAGANKGATAQYEISNPATGSCRVVCFSNGATSATADPTYFFVSVFR